MGWIARIGEIPETPYPFRIISLQEEEDFLLAVQRMKILERELTLDPISRDRTVQQNRAIFKLAYRKISPLMGEEDLREIDAACCAEYYHQNGGRESGTKFKLSKDMTVVEFMAYFKWLQIFAAKTWGVEIVDPDPLRRTTPSVE